MLDVQVLHKHIDLKNLTKIMISSKTLAKHCISNTRQHPRFVHKTLKDMLKMSKMPENDDIIDSFMPYVVSIYSAFSKKLCTSCNNRLSLPTLSYMTRTEKNENILCSECIEIDSLYKKRFWDHVIARSFLLDREYLSMYIYNKPRNENSANYPNWKSSRKLLNIPESYRVLFNFRKTIENTYGEIIPEKERDNMFENFILENFSDKKDRILKVYRSWKKIKQNRLGIKKRKRKINHLCKCTIEKYQKYFKDFSVNESKIKKKKKVKEFIYKTVNTNRPKFKKVKKTIENEFLQLFSIYTHDTNLKSILLEHIKELHKKRPSVIYFGITRKYNYNKELMKYIDGKDVHKVVEDLYNEWNSKHKEN